MDLHAVLAATWPAAETRRLGGWELSRGAGGGKRVSAAVQVGPGGDIAEAEAVMRAWGQVPLFRLSSGQEVLDAKLAQRGYARLDPTLLLAAPTGALAGAAPGETAMDCDGPLACMAEIWDAGGIGPARRAVMARAAGPKAWLLGRLGDAPLGCAFVALHGTTAMLHALEVLEPARRAGLGALLTRKAAHWAGGRNAAYLVLAVAQANAPACALYGRLGFAEAGRYHYRMAPAA